jgi:hypothetical protein
MLFIYVIQRFLHIFDNPIRYVCIHRRIEFIMDRL